MHLPVIGQKRLSLKPLIGQHQADNTWSPCALGTN